MARTKTIVTLSGGDGRGALWLTMHGRVPRADALARARARVEADLVAARAQLAALDEGRVSVRCWRGDTELPLSADPAPASGAVSPSTGDQL
jgi:hypothetical protein